MATQQENEQKLIKAIIASPKSMLLAKSEKLTPSHFVYIPEGNSLIGKSKLTLLGTIFAMADRYWDQSNGSLLTKSVFEHKLSENSGIISDKLIGSLLVTWSQISLQEYDENEIYHLIKHLKRNKSVALAGEMIKSFHSTLQDKSLEEACESAQDYLNRIYDELNEEQSDIEVLDIANDKEGWTEKQYKQRKENPDIFSGVMTGNKEIDDRTQGFQGDQTIILLAPTGSGKSIQALNWAFNANKAGKKILYFSYEMSLWFCVLRHLSLEFKIPFYNLKGLREEDSIVYDVFRKLQQRGDSPYFHYICGASDPTPEFADAMIKQITLEKGKPDLIIFDYIGKMTTRELSTGSAKMEDWKIQNAVAKKLFTMNKKYKIPFIIPQQVSASTIKDNRKIKAAGASVKFAQDAASGPQTLIHDCTYAVVLDPDRDNNMLTYHWVKTRDIWIPPTGAKVDPEFNFIRPLNEDELEDWRNVYGFQNVSKDASGNAVISQPTIRQGEENGQIILQSGDNEKSFTEDDLTMSDEDDFNPDWGMAE